MGKIHRLRNRGNKRSVLPLAVTGLLGGVFLGVAGLQVMSRPTVEYAADFGSSTLAETVGRGTPSAMTDTANGSSTRSNFAGADTRTVASTYVEDTGSFGCSDPIVVDGDTLRCGSTRIRLHGIDAPESEGRCQVGRDCVEGDPIASTESLQNMVAGEQMDCRQTDTDRYGRAVALCSVQGRDLSCAQVQAGHAVRRYAPLSC